NQSSPDGRRTHCESTPFVVTLPSGYYFVTRHATVSWEIDRGTDNRYHLEWADMVEISPDTEVFVPTTVRFWDEARRSSGPNGPAGRSRATVAAPFKRLAEAYRS